MDSDEEDEGWVSIPVSKRQARLALTVMFAALFGAIGYPAISLVAPARYDAYTGEQGRALEHRVEALEYQVLKLQSNSHYHTRRAKND